MNLSGECLRPLMDYYDVDNEDLTVIYDDLDLPTGKIRLRTKGSAWRAQWHQITDPASWNVRV
nr:aminoacyl-tRNA hydrolase [Bacillus subtilis]